MTIKRGFIDFVPIIGIYFYTKKYIKAKKTALNFFQSEEMVLYHFFTPILILCIVLLITKKL